MATADRASGSELAELFTFDPDRGCWWTAVGEKGSGKSDLTLRLAEAYPYDVLLIDSNGDVDPQHRWTEPMPRPLPAAWPEPAEGRRFRRLRYVPAILDDDWVEQADEAIGLAYRRGYCHVHVDEAGDHFPANALPRWSRVALRWGRHRHLSLGMPMPRPAEVSPLTLSQADVISMHSQLHELDVARLARYVRCRDRELEGLLAELDEDRHDFLAYHKRSRSLLACDGLPPRPHASG